MAEFAWFKRARSSPANAILTGRKPANRTPAACRLAEQGVLAERGIFGERGILGE